MVLRLTQCTEHCGKLEVYAVERVRSHRDEPWKSTRVWRDGTRLTLVWEVGLPALGTSNFPAHSRISTSQTLAAQQNRQSHGAASNIINMTKVNSGKIWLSLYLHGIFISIAD